MKNEKDLQFAAPKPISQDLLDEMDRLRAAAPPVMLAKTCHPDVMCPTCNIPLVPEHAHAKCPKCHYRDSCCF